MRLCLIVVHFHPNALTTIALTFYREENEIQEPLIRNTVRV